jgi:hypothetical protein
MKLRRAIRLVLATFATVVVVAAAYVIYWSYFPSVPSITAEQVDSVEVELYEWQDQKSATIASTNSAGIRALLAVLATAKRTSDHKCGDIATITFKRKTGSAEEFGVLPGHDAAYYEFRHVGRINRVNRDEFLSALRGIGVTSILLEP